MKHEGESSDGTATCQSAEQPLLHPCYTPAMRWFPSGVLTRISQRPPAAPVAALLVAVAAAAACAPPASDDPDLILTGGVIYPLDASDEPVPALAIRGALVLALGDNDEILQLAGRYTQQMNLRDSVVLPGTYDAWIDLEALGRWSSAALDVRLASSIEEVQAMVRNLSLIHISEPTRPY